MIFNQSGGGGGLNFKVVGGTSAPSNPKENMIWVNTDTEITSYIFSATEPEAPAEGMVWISTGTSSTVAFNALKKNGIQVYPLSAKQYINGALVDKTAQSYQGGAWVDWWDGTLFDNGNQYESVTGGWKQTTTAYVASTTPGTVTIGNTLRCVAGSNQSAVVCTKNKINLTNFSTLVFNVTELDEGCMIAVSPMTALNLFSAPASSSANTTGLTKLDVSGLSGEHYVYIGCNNVRSATIDIVKLE